MVTRSDVNQLLILLMLVLWILNSTSKNSFIASESPGHTVKIPFEELLKGPYMLPQNDTYLIQHIQNKISPASAKPYNLSKSEVYDQSIEQGEGQSRHILNILGEMKNGFFLECGALDGEFMSNTLVFERKYGWKGLLVEANPGLYGRLLQKQRKAWGINACLSLKPYPTNVMFWQKWLIGKIIDLSDSSNKKGFVKLQCFPLYSIMLALNTTTIDYFSLDIEGKELQVLQTIPWDKMNIKTLSVEFLHIPDGENKLPKYMQSVGYTTYGSARNKNGRKYDYIFHRNDVIPKKRNIN